MNKNKYCRKLRQKIVAIAKVKLDMDIDTLHSIMEEWGYGNSLRKITQPSTLIELKKKLTRDQNFNYDDQGNYMFQLLSNTEWDITRLRQYMIKRFSKTHWNILSQKEKRAVIRMLKNYQKKEQS